MASTSFSAVSRRKTKVLHRVKYVRLITELAKKAKKGNEEAFQALEREWSKGEEAQHILKCVLFATSRHMNYEKKKLKKICPKKDTN